MTNEEKIALLEDMLELEAGTLKPEMELTDIDEYDSMAKLSLIVLFDEECGKKLTGEEIRTFKTVGDIVFTSNTYIVFDEDFDDCWLVDIGDFERAISALPDGKIVKGLLLTHSHFDHIYGINELCNRYPDCVVYASKYDGEALMDDRKNLSRYHEHPIVFAGKNIVTVRENDEIPVCNNEVIKVVSTPGHEPGCLTFYTDEFIFTGDSYIPGVKVVTKLPGGDSGLAVQSV